MEQDFFTYLPPEITINILSRLPVRTAVSCKCVRKSWCSLIETPEFVKSYKSVPSLAVFECEALSIPYKVYELKDELNLENFKNPCNVAFNFSLPQPKSIRSSAKGLLLLSDLETSDNLAICNPVTREYINLPAPFVRTSQWQFQSDTYGFGVSKTTGLYKIVRVFCEGYDNYLSENPEEVPMYWREKEFHNQVYTLGTGLWWEKEFHCQVYTLGTGLWRSIALSISLEYGRSRVGALLNGNIHWLAYDLRGSPWISCFDLETELFSTFSPPHLDFIFGRDFRPGTEGRDFFRTLFALKDCLGLCDNSRGHLVIWLMNNYGDEKSWTKQFVIAKTTRPYCIEEYMFVLKVFKDGDIMMKGRFRIICRSNKTNTLQRTDLLPYHQLNSAVCYTPSFLRLKTFAMENVSSF